MLVPDQASCAADLHICAVPDWNQDELAALSDVGAIQSNAEHEFLAAGCR